MKASELDIGTKLEIQIVDNEDKPLINNLLVSEIESVEQDGSICVMTPIHEGKYLMVHIGVRMKIYTNVKNDYFIFTAKLTKRQKKGNLQVFILTVEKEIEKIQRRQFFRLDCNLKVEYREVNIEGDKIIPKTRFIESITRDISGNGLCIASNDIVNKHTILECDLEIKEKRIIFIGTVVRIIKKETESNLKYGIGIEFTKIQNRDREMIVGYIFEEQRKLRKKGLI